MNTAAPPADDRARREAGTPLAADSQPTEALREVLPCELPCPKCGSKDVVRHFYATGERIPTDTHDNQPTRYSAGGGWYWKAAEDHIRHHCRCCQYGWDTKPLPKQRKRKARP
jgi:hypothetical protein